MIGAKEAIERLKKGNEKYLEAKHNDGDISVHVRKETFVRGQKPYAIIVSCSDSRVIPESIFNCGIGDIFTIRVAGNVMDDHQLGSIEYACGHLDVKLVMVLGHTYCGAVDAAMNHDPEGYIKFITDEIIKAVGDEKNEEKACILNVKHSIQIIEDSLDIQKMEHDDGVKVIGALYHIDTGEVDFL